MSEAIDKIADRIDAKLEKAIAMAGEAAANMQDAAAILRGRRAPQPKEGKTE